MSFVGDIIGGLIGADSTRSAANKQADAVRDSNALQKQMFEELRADNQPLLNTRNSALDQINALLANPSDVTKQPGYEFGLSQGTRALNAGAAARGMNYSGAQAKALTRYGQDYAGTKLDQSYNRLANLAGLGQVATNSNTAAGMNYGNQAGNNLIGLGNAQAGAALRQGSIYGNMVNRLASGWGGFGGSDPGGTLFPQWGSGGGFGSGVEGMGD